MALDVRPSALAGRWYESDPGTLARSVDAYLDEAQLPALEGEVIAVIAPHAGHLYSGPVAGYAFAAFRGRSPDLVALVGPMHHPYVEPLLTTAYAAYSTPLGDIPVDTWDEAVRVVNGVKYGLSSSLFTNDIGLAFRSIRDFDTGLGYVNHGTIGAEAHLPFGGTKATGNGHREVGQASLDFFSEWKSVYIDYSGRLQRAQIDMTFIDEG